MRVKPKLEVYLFIAQVLKGQSIKWFLVLTMAEKVACVLVQYVALRGDLLRVDKWPIGAIVAQACHSSTAVLHQFKDDPSTQQYLKDLDHMRKVVLEVSTNFPNRTISLFNIIY